MKLNSLLILILGLLATASAQGEHYAHPQGRDRGDSRAHEYAQTAVRQARQNRVQGCGYRGNRWSDSYRLHYDWALGESWQSTQAEINKRDSYLRRCADRYGYYRDHYRDDRSHGRSHRRHDWSQPQGLFSQQDLARWYADTALAQVRESNRFNCRLSNSSGRWSRNWREHYRWALGQSRNKMIREIRRRERALEDCVSYAYRGH